MDALNTRTSTKQYIGVCTLTGVAFYTIMRSQLSGTTLKVQMIAFGGASFSQFLLNKNGAKKQYQLLIIATLGVGSYFGKVPLKVAIISTTLLGGSCIALGNYFLINGFLKELETFSEKLNDEKTVITPSIVEECTAFLEDPRLDNRWNLEYDFGRAMLKNSLEVTENEINENFLRSWQDYSKCYVMVGFDRTCSNASFQKAVYDSRLSVRRSSFPVELIFLEYLLKSKSYQIDLDVQNCLLRYKKRDEDTERTPLRDVARVACRVSEAFARENFLPEVSDSEYYSILTAILDSVDRKPEVDPFIAIESHEVKDDCLLTTLEQIRSDHLVEYVGTLLDKFSSPYHLRLAIDGLSERYGHSHPTYVAA